jgi:hypothetical protein
MMPRAISSRRGLAVVATAIFVVAAGVVASALAASAAVENPGPVTITLHDATLGTPLGDFTPMTGTLTGTVAGDGGLHFPKASMTFPSFAVDVTNPIATTVTVTPVADSDFAGHVDPATGRVTLTGNLTTNITLQAFGLVDCPLGPLALNLDTANAGGSAYSGGSATLVDQSFVMPEIPAGAAGCAGYESVINTLVGLPSAPGASTMTMPVTFSPVLASPSSSDSISSTTTTASTTTTTMPTSTTTTTLGTIPQCKPGNGFGDKNDCHSGPPGRGGAGMCDPVGPAASTGAVLPAPTGPVDTSVNVDLDHTVGPPNTDLTGLVWNSGSSIAPVQPVNPRIVRIDGSLQSRSTGPNQLDLTPLLQRVAQVRAIGAEPMVILSYMPRWLGEPRAGATKDPTRVAPYDLDLWQSLVTTVVRTLATAPQPAYMFETWNEPDQSIFWQDTSDAFTATALHSHAAVAQVKRETGLPLEIGGPAAAIGLNPQMIQYLRAVADAHLPLDFVSWHKYANTPYLGPDGAEGNLPPDIYNALAKRNPNSTPLDYSKEIANIKAQVGSALAGSGLHPKFVIDEWNVSAGGYDLRHDTAEGASLVAGILIEMEKAGLDDAAFYRAISGSDDRAGDWGLVHANGTPKPSWWVFRAWSLMTGYHLPTTGDSPSAGLWARATSDTGCVSVLLTNFVATGAPARTVRVALNGTLPKCRGALNSSVAALDGSSTSFANAHALQLGKGNTFTIPMASQSVALVRAGCASS